MLIFYYPPLPLTWTTVKARITTLRITSGKKWEDDIMILQGKAKIVTGRNSIFEMFKT